MVMVGWVKRERVHRPVPSLVLRSWDDVAPAVSPDGPADRPPHGRSRRRWDRRVEEHKYVRPGAALAREDERGEPEPETRADRGGDHLPGARLPVVRVDVNAEVSGAKAVASVLPDAPALTGSEKGVGPGTDGPNEMCAERRLAVCPGGGVPSLPDAALFE